LVEEGETKDETKGSRTAGLYHKNVPLACSGERGLPAKVRTGRDIRTKGEKKKKTTYRQCVAVNHKVRTRRGISKNGEKIAKFTDRERQRES
jgi:hypothetical protein